MAVGLIGGAVKKTHPIARIGMKILNVKSANEFGEVLAAVGLAQNLGSLRALSSEGIQRGHMSLHARNIAVTAGAKDDLVDKVAEQMLRNAKSCGQSQGNPRRTNQKTITSFVFFFLFLKIKIVRFFILVLFLRRLFLRLSGYAITGLSLAP